MGKRPRPAASETAAASSLKASPLLSGSTTNNDGAKSVAAITPPAPVALLKHAAAAASNGSTDRDSEDGGAASEEEFHEALMDGEPPRPSAESSGRETDKDKDKDKETARPARAATLGKERVKSNSIWNGISNRKSIDTGTTTTKKLVKKEVLETNLIKERDANRLLMEDLNGKKAELKLAAKERKSLRDRAATDRAKAEEHAHALFVAKSDLRLALDQAEETRRKADEDVKRMEAHLKQEWESRQTHLVSKLAQQREAADTLKGELVARDEENEELRRVVDRLKTSISLSTRMESMTADDNIVAMARTLSHGVANWAVNFIRGAKVGSLDPSKLSADAMAQIDGVVPFWTRMVGRKAMVVQAVIAGVLVQDVFSAYFFGLPELRAEELQQLEFYLSARSSPADLNLWRSTTLSIIRRSADADLISSLEQASIAVHSRLVSLLSQLTSIPNTHASYQNLTPLLTSAITLSRLLRVQRAIFTLSVPHGLAFDAAEMEDVSGGGDAEDGDDLTGCVVGLATFPSMVKRGDEMGERLEWRNVLCKARVLCLED